jgi:excinuclease ABC subunit C
VPPPRSNWANTLSAWTATHLDVLRLQARSLPQAPGVYFWKDARGRILYIGKAVNLRSRVTSYFSHARVDGRTRQLLSRARAISHELAATELEALLRESALIKQEQPPFNRALRSSRKLYYLKFDEARIDPYMEVVRETENDGSLYFGPFRTATSVRETAAFLHDILPLRKCTRINPRCAPCIYHQMGTCAAPLIDAEHRQRHEEAIARLHDLLDGRNDRIISWLESKRDRLSESLLFERAADVQQRLDSLHELVRRQSILDAAIQCRTLLIFDPGSTAGEARILLVARGNVVSARSPDSHDLNALAVWVKAHEPVLQAIQSQQSELDSASVLERWVSSNRQRVRWVALQPPNTDFEVRRQIEYLLTETDSAL